MKKIDELKSQLETLKEDAQTLLNAKKVDEAKAKMEEAKILKEAISLQEQLDKEEAEILKKLIKDKIEKNSKLKDEIFVISPFKNVANELAKELKKFDGIKFTKYDKNKKPINVGTVHTFQGKEAKIVYFVMGADFKSKGAASWAVSKPNIINVAVTRAKEEFYVIGNSKLYKSIGTNAGKMIELIDQYNENK